MSSLHDSQEAFDFDDDELLMDLDLDNHSSDVDTKDIISAIDEDEEDSSKSEVIQGSMTENFSNHDSHSLNKNSSSVHLTEKKSVRNKDEEGESITSSTLNSSVASASVQLKEFLLPAGMRSSLNKGKQTSNHAVTKAVEESTAQNSKSQASEILLSNKNDNDDIKKELEEILQKSKSSRKPLVPRSKSAKRRHVQSNEQENPTADSTSYKNRQKHYDPETVRLYMMRQKLQRAKEKRLAKQHHQEEEDAKRIALAAIQQRALEEAARTQRRRKVSANNPLPPFVVGEDNVENDENGEPKLPSSQQRLSKRRSNAGSTRSNPTVIDKMPISRQRASQNVAQAEGPKNGIENLKRLFPQFSLTSILSDDDSTLVSESNESHTEIDIESSESSSIYEQTPPKNTISSTNQVTSLEGKKNINNFQVVSTKVEEVSVSVQTPSPQKRYIDHSKLIEQLRDHTKRLAMQIHKLQEKRDTTSEDNTTASPQRQHRHRPASPRSSSSNHSSSNQSLDISLNKLPYEEIPRKSQTKLIRPASANEKYSHRKPSPASSPQASIYSKDEYDDASLTDWPDSTAIKKLTFPHRKEAWTEDLIPPREELHIQLTSSIEKVPEYVGTGMLKDVPLPPPSTRKLTKKSKEKKEKKDRRDRKERKEKKDKKERIERKDSKRARSTKRTSKDLPTSEKKSRSKSTKKVRQSKTPKRTISAPSIGSSKLSEKEQREALMNALRRAAQKSPSRFNDGVSKLLLSRSQEFSSQEPRLNSQPKLAQLEVQADVSFSTDLGGRSNFRLIDVISKQNDDLKRKKDERLREALKQHINKIGMLPRNVEKGSKSESTSKISKSLPELQFQETENLTSLPHYIPPQSGSDEKKNDKPAISKLREELQSLLTKRTQSAVHLNDKLSSLEVEKSQIEDSQIEESQIEECQIDISASLPKTEVHIPSFKEFQSQRPADTRLSPSSLERKMHQVLEVYDKTQESWMQIELMKYNQHIAEVNQETASLAQLLHSRQVDLQTKPKESTPFHLKENEPKLPKDSSLLQSEKTEVEGGEYSTSQLGVIPPMRTKSPERFEDKELRALHDQKACIIEKYEAKEKLAQLFKNRGDENQNTIRKLEAKLASQKANELQKVEEAIRKREQEIQASMTLVENQFHEAQRYKNKLNSVLNATTIPDMHSVFDSVDLESNYDSDSSMISERTDDTETQNMIQEYMFLKQQRRSNADDLIKKKKELEKRRRLAEKILQEKQAIEKERQLESEIREEEEILSKIESEIQFKDTSIENVQKDVVEDKIPETESSSSKVVEKSEIKHFGSPKSESNDDLITESNDENDTLSTISDPTVRLSKLNKDLAVLNEKRMEQKRRLLQHQQDELEEDLEKAKGELISRREYTFEPAHYSLPVLSEVPTDTSAQNISHTSTKFEDTFDKLEYSDEDYEDLEKYATEINEKEKVSQEIPTFTKEPTKINDESTLSEIQREVVENKFEESIEEELNFSKDDYINFEESKLKDSHISENNTFKEEIKFEGEIDEKSIEENDFDINEKSLTETISSVDEDIKEQSQLFDQNTEESSIDLQLSHVEENSFIQDNEEEIHLESYQYSSKSSIHVHNEIISAPIEDSTETQTYQSEYFEKVVDQSEVSLERSYLHTEESIEEIPEPIKETLDNNSDYLVDSKVADNVAFSHSFDNFETASEEGKAEPLHSDYEIADKESIKSDNSLLEAFKIEEEFDIEDEIDEVIENTYEETLDNIDDKDINLEEELAELEKDRETPIEEYSSLIELSTKSASDELHDFTIAEKDDQGTDLSTIKGLNDENDLSAKETLEKSIEERQEKFTDQLVDNLIGKFVEEAIVDVQRNRNQLLQTRESLPTNLKTENIKEHIVDTDIVEDDAISEDFDEDEIQKLNHVPAKTMEDSDLEEIEGEFHEKARELIPSEGEEHGEVFESLDATDHVSSEHSDIGQEYIETSWASVKKYIESILKKANLPSINLKTQEETVPPLMDQLYLDIEKQRRNTEPQQIFNKMIFDCINEAIEDFNGYILKEKEKRLFKETLFRRHQTKKYIGGASQGVMEVPIIPETRETDFEKFIYQKISHSLEYSKLTPSADFALIDIIQTEKPANRIVWGDYHTEELEVKNEVAEMIFDMLIEDTAQWVKELNQNINV